MAKSASPRVTSLWTCWERLSPRRVVLIDAVNNREWTVEQITGEAHRFADRLARHARGERIAFRVANGVEWLALFLALQRAGLTAIPLDAGLPLEGCRDAARRLKASVLYFDGKFHSLGKVSQLSPKVCCVKVTSGSDGLPNGIECGAEHLIADGEQIMRTMKIRAGDRNLAVIPLGHSYGLGNLVMPLLLQGTGLVVAGVFVPQQLVEWIQRHKVTVFPGVPALFRVLAALPPGSGLKPLRLAISAGAVLSPVIACAFAERHGIKIHNFYGSSETGGICYDRTGAASLTGRSVGKPLEGVSISLPKGRVQVRSAAVAMPDRKWLLNDFGEWNGRGELVLLGRHGANANIGGKKVYPLEVERALRSLNHVTDAAVWSMSGKDRDFLAAAVETSLSLGEVEQALARILPDWKRPKHYLIATDLPRTARGKLNFVALRQGIAKHMA